jgi:hypothetical protein
MPQLIKTLGSTIPQPRISTQPVCLQNGQPFPPQRLHEISISALGSVNGKYDGRRRICVDSPNISRAKYKSACFKSAKDTFLSIYKPLNLMERSNVHGTKWPRCGKPCREITNEWVVAASTSRGFAPRKYVSLTPHRASAQ